MTWMNKFILVLLLFSGSLSAEIIKQLKLSFSPKQIVGTDLMPVKGKFRGKFAKKPLIERGAFTLKGDNLLIFNKINKDVLPQSNFTVEAVASIKNSAKYGSIISYMQDNGSYEKGWLLGYNEEKFYFGLATGKSIEYVYSKPYKIK